MTAERKVQGTDSGASSAALISDDCKRGAATAPAGVAGAPDTSRPAATGAPSSLFRCVECGHGDHLRAYSQAVAYGPLAADGSLGTHESTDDCFVFEDSIQCDSHPSALIEKLVDGEYTLPDECPDCRGRGHRPMYPNIGCKRCAGSGQIAVPTDQVLCV